MRKGGRERGRIMFHFCADSFTHKGAYTEGEQLCKDASEAAVACTAANWTATIC